ncbi:polysaccharide pyruvyl transferase family protein [Pontibacter sp. HSC-14F20]|uniref:polysaccharide pyruvyl transferase family protein n=1 Tax=Pontibacter sp. HSC-14F20 TaxID=2864136 RepID=UPI001C73330D|nr:polysaccharide pyruvyl transferase family protein [Pontibacter sp. HSC-14F20]MBX0333242.1 polysaccharide pyruvyl transferase family protein [Pontibacter sp. HSC-14F20]
MNIELRGVGFVNKGAELMLYSILDAFKDNKAQFVMEINTGSTKGKLENLNIYTKPRLYKRGLNLNKFLPIPQAVTSKFGVILENNVDVILDGSGFVFGDKWGVSKANNRLIDYIDYWKRQGKKIILLPQAFGPFENSELRSRLIKIIELADLIFARDPLSFEYITNVKASENIHLMPDFTNLVEGIIPADFDSNLNQIAIIPNSKLVETSTLQLDEYINLLKNIISSLQIRKEKPFFLIHEGIGDLQIANKVNALLLNKVNIIDNKNALEIKGIIGASKATITSRFHGLVSSLTQAVPTLTIGWSHKYEMLLQDYNYPEGLLVINDNIERKLDLILAEESRTSITAKLKTNSEVQKQKSREMWEMVYKVLNN